MHLYSVSLFRHIYYKRVVSGNSPREDLPGWLRIFYSQIVRANQLSSSVVGGKKGNKRVIKKINKCRDFIRLLFVVTELQFAPRWSCSSWKRLGMGDTLLLAFSAEGAIWYTLAGTCLGRTVLARGEPGVVAVTAQGTAGSMESKAWLRIAATPSVPSHCCTFVRWMGGQGLSPPFTGEVLHPPLTQG